jgi:NTE family protein
LLADDSHRNAALAPAGPLRVGLVLGGGGVAGAAFHAGTLLALEHHLGWDPRSADIIVGSSAGSIVATMLRAGLSTDDLAAWAAGAEPRSQGEAARAILDRVDTAKMPLRLPRPRFPLARVARRLTRPTNLRLSTTLLALLPDGLIDAETALRELQDLLPTGWPDEQLWITAVRSSDSRRIVFGRGEYHADLGAAIAASCAIPGLFRPVKIERRFYIDGGAHSPTNADLLRTAPIDVAVISSPMSGHDLAPRRGVEQAMRWHAARRLRRECQILAEAGIPTYVFEPNRTLQRVLGLNALDRHRAPAVIREAFLAAGTDLTALGSHHPLAGLATERASRTMLHAS